MKDYNRENSMRVSNVLRKHYKRFEGSGIFCEVYGDCVALNYPNYLDRYVSYETIARYAKFILKTMNEFRYVTTPFGDFKRN